MRIMGLDYGAKTVGVALSDELFLTAQPLETIWRERETKLRRTLARIEELIREYDVQKIVIGLPKRMDNTEGDVCQKVRQFACMVQERTGMEVILQDERMTTVMAEAVLKEGSVFRADRKAYVDKIAASLILKSYLESTAR